MSANKIVAERTERIRKEMIGENFLDPPPPLRLLHVTVLAKILYFSLPLPR